MPANASPAPPAASGPAGRLRRALGAWQPFTGGGVAAFGAASFARTFAFQLVFALGTTAVVMWSARHAWAPPFTAALARLPESAAGIHDGRLRWPGTDALVLGENPQLALLIDPAGTGELGRTADLQLELRGTGLRLNGLFGHQFLPYPPGLEVPLDRLGGAAAWGAWNWVGLGLLGAATAVALLTFWWGLALALALPVWLAALVLRRALTLGGAGRLTAAAWLPATLVLAAGVFLYATGWLRLPGLAIATGLHGFVALLWLAWGIFMLPDRAVRAKAENPFDPDAKAKRKDGRSAAKQNPFG